MRNVWLFVYVQKQASIANFGLFSFADTAPGFFVGFAFLAQMGFDENFDVVHQFG